MANIEQVRILKEEGVEAWNKWQIENPNVKIDFSKANLREANLRRANLREANFYKADLVGAILYEVDLLVADLRKAYLYRADLRGVNFRGAILYEADLVGAIFNKKGLITGQNPYGFPHTYANSNRLDDYTTTLHGADLRKANLDRADLNGVHLRRADLSESNLSGVQALGTFFKNTIFTGACIEDWNINSETNFDNVICDYIYLKKNQQERRPADTDRNFQPGEFAKLVQISVETVDLIFSNGIDWQSFLQSFQDLRVEGANGEPAIQAIERKTGGTFVVRVEVPPGAGKAKIETSFWKKYNPLLEAKDKEIKLLSQQTEFYSQQVEVIRKDNTRLLGIVETMAEKETIKVQQNFNSPVTGVAGKIEGNQNIFTSQSISQASTEIQNLLTTLQNNGLTQEQAEQKVAQDLANKAENDPTALGKLVNWGKSLGNKAAETSVSEVVRRVIKLALNIAGVPLP